MPEYITQTTKEKNLSFIQITHLKICFISGINQDFGQLIAYIIIIIYKMNCYLFSRYCIYEL